MSTVGTHPNQEAVALLSAPVWHRAVWASVVVDQHASCVPLGGGCIKASECWVDGSGGKAAKEDNVGVVGFSDGCYCWLWIDTVPTPMGRGCWSLGGLSLLKWSSQKL